ncbi:MAG: hypothetical protein ACRBB6_05830 [Neptuniibacter sp.]
MAKRSFWSQLRLLLLVVLLLIVSLNSWLSRVRSTDWQEPLWVAIYPINADQRADTQLFLDALQDEHFDEIEEFFNRESSRYGVTLDQPLQVFLAPEVMGQPPKPPVQASILDSVIWSLKLRYWAWGNDNWNQPSSPDIKIYVRLFSPINQQVLEHSMGLQKGMIGVVNGFSSIDYQAQNNFVTVHEILHTLGASDKYDVTNGQPVWPEGYADPYQDPLLPQYRAEVMGGRVPQSQGFALIPSSLKQVVVGPKTASEINWLFLKD